jgi:hypothetical protein
MKISKILSLILVATTTIACSSPVPKAISFSEGIAVVSDLASEATLNKAKEYVKTVAVTMMYYAEGSDGNYSNISFALSIDFDNPYYYFAVGCSYKAYCSKTSYYKEDDAYYKTELTVYGYEKSTVTQTSFESSADYLFTRYIFQALRIKNVLEMDSTGASFKKYKNNILINQTANNYVNFYELSKLGMIETFSEKYNYPNDGGYDKQYISSIKYNQPLRHEIVSPTDTLS